MTIRTFLWHRTENAVHPECADSSLADVRLRSISNRQPRDDHHWKDNLQDLNATNDRPNVVNATAMGDFNRYAAPTAGTLGNLGRNTYTGPNAGIGTCPSAVDNPGPSMEVNS